MKVYLVTEINNNLIIGIFTSLDKARKACIPFIEKANDNGEEEDKINIQNDINELYTNLNGIEDYIDIQEINCDETITNIQEYY